MPAPARALVSRARRAFARAHRALSTTASPTHETVVGVEIHARLATRSKLFSGAASAYGGDEYALAKKLTTTFRRYLRGGDGRANLCVAAAAVALAQRWDGAGRRGVRDGV